MGESVLQNSLREVQHGEVHAVFQSGNPAFNKLGALLLYLTEHLREIWHQVNPKPFLTAFTSRLLLPLLLM